jgi:tRNA dimethylallyltransferase
MHEKNRTSLERFANETTKLPKVIVVYGPTASGKTTLSLDIAEYIHSEIVSVDSRQMYRGMDIGTGKIKSTEMRWIPHHMIDVIDPGQIFSVVDYVRMALPIIERIQSTGQIPVLCGGTGLYIDGLLYEMGYPDTPPDWSYRAELEKIRTSKWNQALWNMLDQVDPVYAHEVGADNYRYVMRWLEVIRQTWESKSLSKGKKVPRFDPLFLTPYSDTNRPALYQNIDDRVTTMFDDWLKGEVESIIWQYGSDCIWLTTIWYREVVEAIEWKITLDEAKSLIQQRSRNYAKRQITWNKRYEQNNSHIW